MKGVCNGDACGDRERAYFGVVALMACAIYVINEAGAALS